MRQRLCTQATFGGDLDLFLVLAVIGERTYSQQNANPHLSYDEFRSGLAATTPIRDINLRSIAEFSGIPRETVRRKIAELTERGWITRNSDDSLVATANASSDLEPLIRASIAYVANMMTLLKDALAETSGMSRKS